MIRLPIDESRDEKDQVLFVDESLWVPINVVNGNVHILPGIPRLFTQLLDGLVCTFQNPFSLVCMTILDAIHVSRAKRVI